MNAGTYICLVCQKELEGSKVLSFIFHVDDFNVNFSAREHHATMSKRRHTIRLCQIEDTPYGFVKTKTPYDFVKTKTHHMTLSKRRHHMTLSKRRHTIWLCQNEANHMTLSKRRHAICLCQNEVTSCDFVKTKTHQMTVKTKTHHMTVNTKTHQMTLLTWRHAIWLC